jgi:hypothetical protein
MLLTLPLLQLTTPTTTPTAFSFLPFFLSVCARVRYFKSHEFLFLHFSFFLSIFSHTDCHAWRHNICEKG